MTYRRGPSWASVEATIPKLPRRHNGSSPPWHTYDAQELGWNRPDEPYVFLIERGKKGNLRRVRLLQHDVGPGRDGTD